MRVILILATLLLAATTASAGTITFDVHDGDIAINIGARCIASYVWNDPETIRPFFANVTAPDGTIVTRMHPPDAILDKDNDDHGSFHPGIWLAFGDINGADVWRLKARVRHDSFVVQPTSTPSGGTFTVKNLYETLDAPPKPIATEVCRYTIVVDTGGYYLLSQSTFMPAGDTLTFGDQEEMGFGIRLPALESVRKGGVIVNSNGGKNEAGTWGKSAEWCAGYGKFGTVYAGALLIPAPGNFRPSWFHSRDYGLLVANPFGKKALTAPDDPNVKNDSTVVTREKPLTLGFGLYLFSTPNPEPDLKTPAAKLAKLLSEYAP